MSMEVLLHDYGWAGVFLYVLAKEIIPWFRQRMDHKEDSEAAMKEAGMARDAAREERMVKAMENMAESNNAIQTILSAVNVRLEIIERHLGLPAKEPTTQPRPKGRTQE